MLSRLAAPVAALLLTAFAGCAAGQADRQPPAAAGPPELGSCRVLTPADVAEPSNGSATVPCSRPHTAETFAVGTFPTRVTSGGDRDGAALGRFVYRTCDRRFEDFLGGEPSSVMRTTLTWAWFRPPQPAWDKGARWYRCDVLATGEQPASYASLPRTARGVLLGRPADRWMLCVDGPTVAGAAKLPCTGRHTWRAVTTIVLGKAQDAYPGDRLVEVRTRDFCSDSVGAWMNYPVDYDFGYTWFHRAEWKTGNRRSICWARTDQ